MKAFIKLSIITLAFASSLSAFERPPLPPRPGASLPTVPQMNNAQAQFNQALVEQQELNRQQAAAIANMNQAAAAQQQNANLQNQAMQAQRNRVQQYRNRSFGRKVLDLLAGCGNAQF